MRPAAVKHHTLSRTSCSHHDQFTFWVDSSFGMDSRPLARGGRQLTLTLHPMRAESRTSAENAGRPISLEGFRHESWYGPKAGGGRTPRPSSSCQGRYLCQWARMSDHLMVLLVPSQSNSPALTNRNPDYHVLVTHIPEDPGSPPNTAMNPFAQSFPQQFLIFAAGLKLAKASVALLSARSLAGGEMHSAVVFPYS